MIRDRLRAGRQDVRVEQQKFQASVMGDDAGVDPLVGGLDEFVDQLGAGDVADSAALLAGGQAEPDQ